MLNAFPPSASSLIRKISFPIRAFAILCQMDVKTITPILNMSDIAASFAWFGKWGLEEVLGLGHTRNLRRGRSWRIRDLPLARGAKEGAARDQIPPRFGMTETKQPITACGCRFG